MRQRAYTPPRAAWNGSPARTSPAHPSAMPPPLRPGAGPQPALPTNETSYIEDVDPRFAEPPVVAPVHRLTPPPVIDTDHPYDSIPEGARSPAESEHSTFTSISQRGINPRWPGDPPPPMMGRPMGPMAGYQGVPPRKPAPQLNNVLLDNNPDFQLPGARGRGGPPRGGAALGYPAGLR